MVTTDGRSDRRHFLGVAGLGDVGGARRHRRPFGRERTRRRRSPARDGETAPRPPRPRGGRPRPGRRHGRGQPGPVPGGVRPGRPLLGLGPRLRQRRERDRHRALPGGEPDGEEGPRPHHEVLDLRRGGPGQPRRRPRRGAGPPARPFAREDADVLRRRLLRRPRAGAASTSSRTRSSAGPSGPSATAASGSSASAPTATRRSCWRSRRSRGSRSSRRSTTSGCSGTPRCASRCPRATRAARASWP